MFLFRRLLRLLLLITTPLFFHDHTASKALLID